MKIFVYTGKMESNTILSNVRHTEQINDCLLQRSPKNNLIPGLVQVGTGSTWKFQLGTGNELSKISFKFFLVGFEVHSDLQICLGLFLDRPLYALVLVQNLWGYS